MFEGKKYIIIILVNQFILALLRVQRVKTKSFEVNFVARIEAYAILY